MKTEKRRMGGKDGERVGFEFEFIHHEMRMEKRKKRKERKTNKLFTYEEDDGCIT